MVQGRVQTRYTGHVQGVGFRYSVHRIASDFPVFGYVMNLPDGSVELVAEGQRTDLRSFLQAIAESNLGGFIHGVHSDWSEFTGAFTDFRIRTTPR